MEGKVGPLADGRPYTRSENLKKIEAYHKAIVVAHKNHESPKVALPKF